MLTYKVQSLERVKSLEHTHSAHFRSHAHQSVFTMSNRIWRICPERLRHGLVHVRMVPRIYIYVQMLAFWMKICTLLNSNMVEVSSIEFNARASTKSYGFVKT